MRAERMYHSVRLLLIRRAKKRAEYLKKHDILGEIGENKELNVIQRFKVFREQVKKASEEPLVEPKNGLRDISDLKGVTLS